MRRVRAELIDHVGGRPSGVDAALIERTVRLSIHLELLDERSLHGESFTLHNNNVYLAWSNALVRTLTRLGAAAAAAAPKAPTLADIAADIERTRPPAA